MDKREQDTDENRGAGPDQGEGSNGQSSLRQWSPTDDQIRVLEDFYQNNGDIVLSDEQIRSLHQELCLHGAAELGNVHYWYMIHRVQAKQKKRSLEATTDAPTQGLPKRGNSACRVASPSEYRLASFSEGVIPLEGFVVPSSPFPVQGETFPRSAGGADETGSEMEFPPMSSQLDPSLEHYLTDDVDDDEMGAQSELSPLSPIQDDGDASQDPLRLSLGLPQAPLRLSPRPPRDPLELSLEPPQDPRKQI